VVYVARCLGYNEMSAHTQSGHLVNKGGVPLPSSRIGDKEQRRAHVFTFDMDCCSRVFRLPQRDLDTRPSDLISISTEARPIYRRS
jgi:hypothetical protein